MSGSVCNSLCTCTHHDQVVQTTFPEACGIAETCRPCCSALCADVQCLSLQLRCTCCCSAEGIDLRQCAISQSISCDAPNKQSNACKWHMYSQHAVLLYRWAVVILPAHALPRCHCRCHFLLPNFLWLPWPGPGMQTAPDPCAPNCKLCNAALMSCMLLLL